MRASFAFASAALLTLVAIVVVPGPGAGVGEPELMYALYLDDPVTTVKPTATESKTKLMCDPCIPTSVTKPVITFGPLPNNGFGEIPWKPTSAVLLTMWLSASEEVPITDFELQFTRTPGGAIGASMDWPPLNETGEPIMLTPEPQRISFAFAYNMSNAMYAQNQAMGVVLRLSTLAPYTSEAGEGVEVLIHYGSAVHPSGIFFTANQPVPASKAIGGGLFTAYFSEDGYKSERPSENTPKRFNFAGGFPDPVTIRWANGTADRSYTFLTDMVLQVWLDYTGTTFPQSAAAFVDLTATLVLKDQNLTGYYQKRPRADCTSVCIPKLGAAITFNTTGLELNKGDPYAVELSLRSVTTSEALTYVIEYDGWRTPSGLIAAVEEAGGEASTTSQSGSPSSSGSSSSSSTSSAPTTTTTATTSATNSTNETDDSAGGLKDVGNPAQVLPNVTFAVGLAAAAMALAIAGRRRRA